MNEPWINVDHFYHRPICHVVGLPTEKSQIPAISSELESAGADVAAVCPGNSWPAGASRTSRLP